MSELAILCVEDEPEVRNVLVRDLAPFEAICRVEEAEDAEDARAVIAECLGEDAALALVLCDHVMPGTNGVDLLVELDRDPATRTARKVLVTGQAGHEDTIRAINRAHLDHYLAKPWTRDELHAVVRDQLTEFVLANVENVLPYVEHLDGERLLDACRHRGIER